MYKKNKKDYWKKKGSSEQNPGSSSPNPRSSAQNPETSAQNPESNQSNLELHDQDTESTEQTVQLPSTDDVEKPKVVNKRNKATQTKKVKIISLPTSDEDEVDDEMASDLTESVPSPTISHPQVSMSVEARKPSTQPLSILSLLPRIETSSDGNSIIIVPMAAFESMQRNEEFGGQSIDNTKQGAAHREVVDDNEKESSVGKENRRPSSSPSKGAIPKKRKQDPITCAGTSASAIANDDHHHNNEEYDSNVEIAPQVRRDNANYANEMISPKKDGDDDKLKIPIEKSAVQSDIDDLESNLSRDSKNYPHNSPEFKFLSDLKELLKAQERELVECDNYMEFATEEGNSAEMNKNKSMNVKNESSSPSSSSIPNQQQLNVRKSLFTEEENEEDEEGEEEEEEEVVKNEKSDENNSCYCRIKIYPEQLYSPTDNNRPHCTLCDIPFGRYSSYYQHFAQFHPNIATFDCTICGERFINSITLIPHFIKCKNTCHICDKQFPNPNELVNHLKRMLHVPNHINLESLDNIENIEKLKKQVNLMKSMIPRERMKQILQMEPPETKELMEPIEAPELMEPMEPLKPLKPLEPWLKKFRVRSISTPRSLKFKFPEPNDSSTSSRPSSSCRPSISSRQPSSSRPSISSRPPSSSRPSGSYISTNSSKSSNSSNSSSSSSSIIPSRPSSSSSSIETDNIQCSLCEQKFGNIQSLRMHEENLHFKNLMDIELNYKSCNKCNGMILISPNSIDFKSPKYKCKQCMRQFYIESHLEQHEIVHKYHNQLLRVPCCQLEFHCSAMKSFHTIIHPTYIECDDCGLIFDSILALSNHKYLKTRGEQMEFQ